MTNITYYGHSNFVLETNNNLKIAFDPWITGNPSFPKNTTYPNVDYILLSHGHSDHSGNTEKILKENKNTKLICQFELGQIYARYYKVNPNQIVFSNIGSKFNLEENLFVKTVRATHSSSLVIDNNIVYAGDPMGFIVNDNGFNIYYAGDTAYTHDMKFIGENFDIDVAILPIGSVFTMDFRDAINAIKDLKAKIFIPMHYNTFPDIFVDTTKLEKECKENNINIMILDIGQERKL